jgi:hypothetical protein
LCVHAHVRACVCVRSKTDVLLYVAHLYKLGYASSSIYRVISIIGYYHKLHQFPDPTSSFLVKKILAGVAKSTPSSDLRAPITTQLLQSLVRSCPCISQSAYNASLLSSMYLLAFHAFLRIWEITVSHSKASNPNLLQFHQVSLPVDQIIVTFSSFKHHQGPPISLVIQARPPPYCPVTHLSLPVPAGLHT